MNYDLALMALEGLARKPLHVKSSAGEVVIEATPAAFKELARLCLLLGGSSSSDDAFELNAGTHTAKGSPLLRLRLIDDADRQ